LSARTFRLAWRALRLAVHILQGLLTCALVLPWAGAGLRGRLVQSWSARVLRICGVRLLAPAAPMLEHALVVANHVSWLDIFVINALAPSRFVAKAEIRAWPVLGWLAEMGGTVFIARGSRRDLRHIFKGLVDALATRRRVAFFPEGTTGAQGSPLPFHANLFEAALDAGVPVQPLALAYLRPEGGWHPAVDFTGDTTFADSILRILGGAGPILAHVACLTPIATAGRHRRALAHEAEDVIGAALKVPPTAI
jgi:1-acyl-sn-glycerol-3-phosphate acyltransferase